MGTACSHTAKKPGPALPADITEKGVILYLDK